MSIIGGSYDPAKVKVIIGGVLIGGFAPGTFLDIKRSNGRWSMKVGADGEAAFQKSNDNSGILELTLMGTADENMALDAIWQADGIINAGEFPVDITDLSTGTQTIGLQARIINAPDLSYGTEVPEKKWTIGVLQMGTINGGKSVGSILGA